MPDDYITQHQFEALYPLGAEFQQCRGCELLLLLAPGDDRSCTPAHSYSQN
jgi:hypothetical protein